MNKITNDSPLWVGKTLAVELHDERCFTGHVRVQAHEVSAPAEYTWINWLRQMGTLLLAPGPAQVDAVKIQNQDERPHLVSVRIDGEDVQTKVSLGPGDALVWSPGDGWRVQKWEGR